MSAPLSPAAAQAQPAMSPVLVVVLLGLLLGLQPLATDLYLPALPSIQAAFSTQVSQVQLTLTAFLLAFGCSQLAWGPLSDRFGRRPILLAGMSIYVLAALGSASAETMESLIAWRALQGASLGAGVMCARAMVRDLFAPHLGAQVMSKALTGLGVIAFLSPVSGSLLVDSLGWRSTMLAQAVMGALALLLVALRFTETLARTNPTALQPLALARNWITILRHPGFQSYQLLTCCTYAALFTNLAASSFTYIHVLGVSRTGYGLLMGSNALCYIAGTFLCRWLLQRMDVRRAVQLAGLASLLSATAIGIAALADARSLWAYALPFYIFQIAHGVHMPCGQSNAIAPFPQSAGTASALNGFTMMLIAFAMGHWLGLHLDGQSTRPMAFGIWFWGVCTALVAWGLVRRHGRVDGHR